MREFLNDCYRVETLAARIYERLAAEESYAPRVSAVFRRLAEDEHTHAQYLDMLLQAPEEVLDGVPGVAGHVIDDAVRSAQEMFDAVESQRLSEETALRMAVRMEQKFVVVHANTAVHSYNPRVSELLVKLNAEDKEHLGRLRSVLAWWRSEGGGSRG